MTRNGFCELCDCEEPEMPEWLHRECTCECHVEVPQELLQNRIPMWDPFFKRLMDAPELPPERKGIYQKMVNESKDEWSK